MGAVDPDANGWGGALIPPLETQRTDGQDGRTGRWVERWAGGVVEWWSRIGIVRTFQSRVRLTTLAWTFTMVSPAWASAMLGHHGGHEGEGGKCGVEVHGGELRAERWVGGVRWVWASWMTDSR
jgi:hypothetical protein